MQMPGMGPLAYRARVAITRQICPIMKHSLDRMTVSQFCYSGFVSERFRYVYINNPKTGCTSLKSALVELETRDTGAAVDAFDTRTIHGPASPLKRYLPLVPSLTLTQRLRRGYAFVSFVRNPYTRLLSCYLDKIVRRHEPTLRALPGPGVPDDFPGFVRQIVAQPDRAMDIHWRPQTANLHHDRIAYTFLGRFETYDTDYARVFEVLAIPPDRRPPPRHLNPTGRSGRVLRDFYTPEIQDLVYERYQADFAVYGYGHALEATSGG